MDDKKCDIVFVNSLAVSGFSNGIINLAFATARFVPEENEDGVNVVLDEFISANLRMDLFCAQQLRDRLDAIIEENTKARIPS
jgi:hypothetical protein